LSNIRAAKAGRRKTDRGMHKLSLSGELAIVHAADIRAQLLAAFDSGTDVEVDLAQVTEIDTAGVQLMAAAKREAAARNVVLRFTGHSPAVVELLDLYDLAGFFGDPMLLHRES
jgi:anti-sigma B factor antagonist